MSIREHWLTWRPLYIVGAVSLGLALVGRWASAEVEERDRGITWVFAYSPETMQTYQVRAKAEHGRLQHFALESGDTYTFSGCELPAEHEVTTCIDSYGRSWTIEI